MEELKVAKYLEQNKEFLFPNEEFTDADLENALLNAPDEFETLAKAIPFRNPSTVQIIAVFPGSLGVDRFYLGEIGKGILKYFTLGGFGIWWIKDIISAKGRCRTYNCRKLMDAINDPSVIAQMQKNDAKINQAASIAKAFAPAAKEIVKGAKNVRNTLNVD